MIDPDSPFDWAERLQDDPEDIRFRRKAWIVIGCGLIAFWIVAAGVLASLG